MAARRSRSTLNDTLPDGPRPMDGEEPTQPAVSSRVVERARTASGVRGRRARRAVLEIDAAPHHGDRRREDD